MTWFFNQVKISVHLTYVRKFFSLCSIQIWRLDHETPYLSTCTPLSQTHYFFQVPVAYCVPIIIDFLKQFDSSTFPSIQSIFTCLTYAPLGSNQIELLHGVEFLPGLKASGQCSVCKVDWRIFYPGVFTPGNFTLAVLAAKIFPSAKLTPSNFVPGNFHTHLSFYPKKLGPQEFSLQRILALAENIYPL